MTATIIDFKTRKILNQERPIQPQQEELSEKEVMETLVEIVGICKKQGYTFDKALLIMPSTDKDISPVTISMDEESTARDMANIVKPAYVNLVKAAKQEEMPDVPA